MTEMTLPAYVDYGGLVCCPTPFSCRRTTLDGFFVKADGKKLDALCKRVFSEPTNGAVEYVALGDFVMLAWGITDASSLTTGSERPGGTPWNERGAVHEPQVCVWVPAAAVKRNGNKLRAHKFVWFLPYIWVDNAMSLATGRETLGYPKTFGRFTFPSGGDPRSWTVDAFGLNYSPTSMAAYHPLLQIKQTGGFGETINDGFDNLRDLGLHIAHRLFGTTQPGEVRPDVDFIKSIFGDFGHKRMPQVFFKQFRSAEDGLGACLQQVVEAHYQITKIKGFPYPHLQEFGLEVHQLDSHPLFEDLGLANQQVRAAYHIEMDFEVRGGKVLWQRCGENAAIGNGVGGLIGRIPWFGRRRTPQPA
jgi:acetoacetate decarboxylase